MPDAERPSRSPRADAALVAMPAPRARAPSAARRYAAAVAAAAIALALTALVVPVSDRGLHLFFFTAVVASAWYGGLGPGLLTTALAIAATDFLFLEPRGEFNPVAASERVALALFAVLAVATSTLSARLRDARARAERASESAHALAVSVEAHAGELAAQMHEARALTAELERSNRVLASLDDAFVALDADMRCRFVNDAARRLVRDAGGDPDALPGAVPWAVLPALFPPPFEDAVREAAASRTVHEREATIEGSGRTLQVRVHPAHEGVTVAMRDVTERRAAERAQALLADVARLLATSRELDATLHALTSLLVPAVADYCMVYLVDDDGTAHQAAYRHVDPSCEPVLAELGERWHPGAHTPRSAVVRALRTTAAVVGAAPTPDEAAAVVDDPDVLRLLRALAPASYVVVPLVARDRTIGTITLASSVSGRRYGDDDVRLAELVAARAALAVDNARLRTDAQRARERALHAARLEARLEAQLARARLDALRAQLNPHFLFNTLNTIAMLVRRDANDEALRALIDLSALLRQVLQGHGTAETPLADELRLTERYLGIEQLRFRDRLRVEVAVETDALDAYLPTMLLQPLVENAVKHGVARRRDATRIDIAASRRGERLAVEIRDDGPGFPAGWSLDASEGVGLATTRDRLRQLYGDDHRLDAGTPPEGGARVAIEIPYHRAPRPRAAVGAPAEGEEARP